MTSWSGIDSSKVLNDDLLEWDRLSLSRTCRQIFAETAQRYFEQKLLPLSSRKGISYRGISGIVRKLTPSQRNCVTTISLTSTQYGCLYDWDFATLKHLHHLQFFNLKQISGGIERKEEVARQLRLWIDARITWIGQQHEPLVLE